MLELLKQLDFWVSNTLLGFTVMYFSGCLIVTVGSVFHAMIEEKKYEPMNYIFYILGSWFVVFSCLIVLAFFLVFSVCAFIGEGLDKLINGNSST